VCVCVRVFVCLCACVCLWLFVCVSTVSFVAGGGMCAFVCVFVCMRACVFVLWLCVHVRCVSCSPYLQKGL